MLIILILKQFDKEADSVESAIANAFPILPVVLTTHGVSAANNLYWPEIYTNLSIADPNNKNPFFDTPSPKVFGNVSPMDPQLFMRINDFADELLKGERSGKYSPIEYAQWIEDFAEAADKHLAAAKINLKGNQKPEFRRMAVDVAIAAGLGRFFGAKFRAGVLFGIFRQSADRNALELSVKTYQKARNFWIELTEVAKDIYKHDITVGELDVIRGHWLDRLPAIDEDIDFMKKILERTPASETAQQEIIRTAIKEALGRPERPAVACYHKQPEYFKTGESLELEISVEKTIGSILLYYRHVNQAERYKSAEMKLTGKSYRAAIPADYTDTQYPLQYYFELKDTEDAVKTAWLYPGFSGSLTNQPYFVVRRS